MALWGRALQAEGAASAKTLRQEPVVCLWNSKEAGRV